MKVITHVFILTILISGCAGSHNSENSSSASALVEAQPAIPGNRDEEAMLKNVAKASIGKSFNQGQNRFMVTNSYFAASGRECKSIEITTSENNILYKTVCDYDGTWGYSPEVLPSPSNQ